MLVTLKMLLRMNIYVVFLLSKQITEYHATLQLFTPLRVFIHPLTTTGDRFLQIRENQ